jgi:hypothetical protein
MTLARLWQAWSNFWFQMQSPLPMAVFRIFFGLHVLLFVVLLLPDLATWYGPDGLLNVQTNRQWQQTERLSIFSWLPPTVGTAYGVFALLAISAFTLTIGLFTRTSSIILALMLYSIHHRNMIILNGGDNFMRLVGLYLVFSHAGDALSVDNWLKRKLGKSIQTEYSIWAQRLVQLQLSAVYCHSVFGKINGESWLNGTAVYYASRLQDFEKLPVPYLLDNMWTINLLTWSTLFIEFALFTLVWIKDFRYYVLAAGILLHLGIEWTMNIPMFETQMIAAFIVFVDPKDIQSVLDRLKSYRVQERIFAAGPEGGSDADNKASAS